MSTKITTLLTVLLGASITTLVVFMIIVGVFDVIQEPELTETLKISFGVAGGLSLLYVILCFSIKCSHCGERLMFIEGVKGEAKGWDDLLKSALFNNKVHCQHCSHPNDFKK